MLLAGLFLAAIARSLASPMSIAIPDSTSSSPNPICIVAAAAIAAQCDPTRTRTLLDILYSCIGVILLCTYISIHHNIPDRDTTWAHMKWMRVKTTLYALMAPEFVIMWAIRERIMAGRIAEKMTARGHRWTRTHGFFVRMGGLVQVKSDSTCRVPHKSWDLHELQVPRIPEKEIKDHGKGDLLAKAIVVIQTTWFVAQCIARRAQGLVLTEIELVTLAFATLNVITYGLWWDKPLNIEYPIYFDEEGKRVDGPEERTEGAWYAAALDNVKGYLSAWREYSQRRGMVRTIWQKGVKALFSAVFGPLMDMMVEREHSGREDNFFDAMSPDDDDNERFLAVAYGSAVGVIFGGLHLIGWNFSFPTNTELWLWRVSSLLLTTVPLFLAITVAIFGVANGSDSDSEDDSDVLLVAVILIVRLTYSLCPLIYFAARVVILFLAFFTLRSLPESAYQNVRWTEFLPHI